MSPEHAMHQAREDIAELRNALTRSSCERQHSAIGGFCRALLECDVITRSQWQGLLAEADAALAGWQALAVLPAEWRG